MAKSFQVPTSLGKMHQRFLFGEETIFRFQKLQPQLRPWDPEKEAGHRSWGLGATWTRGKPDPVRSHRKMLALGREKSDPETPRRSSGVRKPNFGDRFTVQPLEWQQKHLYIVTAPAKTPSFWVMTPLFEGHGDSRLLVFKFC